VAGCLGGACPDLDLEGAAAGKVTWVGLVYTLLLLPDDRHSALLLCDLLGYLQDAAPSDVLTPTGRGGPSLQAAGAGAGAGAGTGAGVAGDLLAFPRVLSQLLLHHCSYAGVVRVGDIVVANVSRDSIRWRPGGVEADVEVEEMYRNICSLRYVLNPCDPICLICNHVCLLRDMLIILLLMLLMLLICYILTIPCPALPCPALPCPALPCPALPCPAPAARCRR
jgi:hypothetical protein